MTVTASATGAARYGAVAQTIHWLVVVLAIIVVSLGWVIGTTAQNTPIRTILLVAHRSVGLTILAVMVVRALWRCRHPPPPLPASVGIIEAGLVRLTHLGLYLIFVLMPLSGYLNAAAAGHRVSFYGLFEIPELLPANARASQWAIAIHLAGQYLVYLLVALHVTGALYHAAIRRDTVLDRMLPRRAGTRLRT